VSRRVGVKLAIRERERNGETERGKGIGGRSLLRENGIVSIDLRFILGMICVRSRRVQLGIMRVTSFYFIFVATRLNPLKPCDLLDRVVFA